MKQINDEAYQILNHLHDHILTIHDVQVPKNIFDSVDCGKVIEPALEKIQALIDKARIQGGIDELSDVQTIHGNYITQTFAHGQAMSVEERIMELKSNIDGK